jgi:hypothetical protein
MMLLTATGGISQVNIDTLALQDFETSPAAPVWNYIGTFADLQSGNASPTSSIPNTPLGIGSSQAWHVASVSGGNEITFDNTAIPAGYDTIRVNFSLSAMNLNGSTGGPDNGDYVLVEYSLDNGTTWVGRLRIRGFSTSGAFWAHDATGVAQEYYLPATESMYQPTSTGLQDAEGYSFCEIKFPGTITELAIRITPRSSSSSDSWLIDNLVLTGENACSNSTNSFTVTECDSYTAPSGAIYTTTGIIQDIIPNSSGCDSIMTIDVTINSVSDITTTLNGISITANNTNSNYTWINCDDNNAAVQGETGQSFTPTTNGNYAVVLSENGCVDTSDCVSITTVGIVENSFQNEINLFPNPTGGSFEIDLGMAFQDIALRIITLDGKEVLSKSYNQIQKINLSLEDHPAGIYMVNLSSIKEQAIIRLVKD